MMQSKSKLKASQKAFRLVDLIFLFLISIYLLENVTSSQ